MQWHYRGDPMRFWAIFVVCLLAAAPAFAACPTTTLTFKDSGGIVQTLCFGGASGAFIPQYQILDSGGTNALGINASGQIGISNFPATQTVSGTVTANQGGTWNVGLSTGSNTVGKVDILGNAGATLDATVAAGTAPTNGVAMLGQFNSTAPAPTTGQTVALQVSGVGNLMTENGCAGQTLANTLTAPINNAAASANLKIITKAAAKKIYICGINIGPVGAAVNVALVSGTLTTNQCDTSTAGLAGGATAATGWILPANGGLAYGNGVGLVAGPAATNTDVCLLFSGAVQVSGVVTYAQF